eukprot:SAG11_NODE_1946_length_4019_cov_1.215306_1_plen_134_part_00
MPSPRRKPKPTLTPREQRIVLEHRLLGMLWEIKFGLVSATRAAQLIRICGGSGPKMAIADAIMWSGDGILNVIFQPLVGALSDAYVSAPNWRTQLCRLARIQHVSYMTHNVRRWKATTMRSTIAPSRRVARSS